MNTYLLLGHLAGSNRLSDGADLVNLKEETRASLLLNTHLDTLGVGNKEIITDNLQQPHVHK